MVGAIVVVRILQRLLEGELMFASVKRNPESFRKNPPTKPPLPQTLLFVCVSATALPSLSTTDRCVVSPLCSSRRSPTTSGGCGERSTVAAGISGAAP
jgi:hypothetical protein